MRPLTARQLEVLRVIERLSTHYPPTVRELAAELGVTRSAAWCHLKALRKKGLVEGVCNGKERRRTMALTRAGTIAAAPARRGTWPPVLVIEDRRAELVWEGDRE